MARWTDRDGMRDTPAAFAAGRFLERYAPARLLGEDFAAMADAVPPAQRDDAAVIADEMIARWTEFGKTLRRPRR